jgi:hypothetical protein
MDPGASQSPKQKRQNPQSRSRRIRMSQGQVPPRSLAQSSTPSGLSVRRQVEIIISPSLVLLPLLVTTDDLKVFVVRVMQQTVLCRTVLLLVVVLGEDGSVFMVFVVLLQPAELDLEVAAAVHFVPLFYCVPRGDSRLVRLNGILKAGATVIHLSCIGKIFLNTLGVLSCCSGGHGAAADVVEVEVQASLPLQFLLLLLLLLLLLEDGPVHCKVSSERQRG